MATRFTEHFYNLTFKKIRSLLGKGKLPDEKEPVIQSHFLGGVNSAPLS